EGGSLDELRALIVAQPPDIAPALEVVVHRAEVSGRVTVRDQTAPSTDQNRQVLDPDRALILAGAARRALPQHVFGVDVAELPVARAGKQRVLGLQDDRLGVERLPRPPRRTVHLTAPAFDARECVEHHLAAEILYRLEAHLLLLEIEVRQV